MRLCVSAKQSRRLGQATRWRQRIPPVGTKIRNGMETIPGVAGRQDKSSCSLAPGCGSRMWASAAGSEEEAEKWAR